jgi:hypothetical protein
MELSATDGVVSRLPRPYFASFADQKSRGLASAFSAKIPEKDKKFT